MRCRTAIFLSWQQVSTSWGVLDLQEVEASTHVYRPQLLSGRWFLPNELDVLLLNDTAANTMQRTVGETLAFTDKTVRPGHATTWTIIGIVHDESVARGGLGVAITTPENFHHFYGLAPGEVDGGIFVQSRQHDPSAISRLVAQLVRALNHPAMTAGVVTYQDFTHLTLGPRTQFQLALFYVVSAFVALISLFTLIMVQLRSVMERKREIGIMRALGARGWQVAIVFWVEGGIEGIIAWVIAILFSVPAAYGFLQLFLSNATQSYVPFAYDRGRTFPPPCGRPAPAHQLKLVTKHYGPLHVKFRLLGDRKARNPGDCVAPTFSLRIPACSRPPSHLRHYTIP